MKKKAVALKYPEGADAPFISAGGSGFVADEILRIAQENNVPVVQDSELTELLSIGNIGDYIPEETYMAVAKILVFISRLEGNYGRNGEQENSL